MCVVVFGILIRSVLILRDMLIIIRIRISIVISVRMIRVIIRLLRMIRIRIIRRVLRCIGRIIVIFRSRRISMLQVCSSACYYSCVSVYSHAVSCYVYYCVFNVCYPSYD